MRTANRLLLVALALGSALALPAAGQGKSARPLVVVDAGHGGVDPGARGPRGTREKDVTLAYARALARALREDADVEVRMTRDADTLIALRDRPRAANRWRQASGGGDRPAVFVSIHCNASSDPSIRGVESFFLSTARTEDARRVAAMENAAQKYEDDESGEGDALSFIVNDLRRNLYLRASDALAERVQKRLARVAPGPDRGVKQAGFVVLDGAYMPAVLVEIGFLTNRADEARLLDPDVRRRIAAELAGAIRAYLRSPG